MTEDPAHLGRDGTALLTSVVDPIISRHPDLAAGHVLMEAVSCLAELAGATPNRRLVGTRNDVLAVVTEMVEHRLQLRRRPVGAS